VSGKSLLTQPESAQAHNFCSGSCIEGEVRSLPNPVSYSLIPCRAAARKKKPGTHSSVTTSPTVSSVSSLTASDQLPGEHLPTERAHSRLVQTPRHGPKAEPAAKQSQWLHKVQTGHSVSRLVSNPSLHSHRSLRPRSQPTARPKPTLLIISDSESEATTTSHSSASRNDPWSPVTVSLPADCHLPSPLAGITKTKLSAEGDVPHAKTLALRSHQSIIPAFHATALAIASDPKYLGGPEHIQLHNSNGRRRYHEVVHPPLEPLTPVEKWYIVTHGTRVGIFVDW
jgi:hypothetical protein